VVLDQATIHSLLRHGPRAQVTIHFLQVALDQDQVAAQLAHLDQQVLVQVVQVDQREIAANVQVDLADQDQVAQVERAQDQVALADLAQREIVPVDLVVRVQVAQVLADLLAQERREQRAHQVLVQVVVRMHQVVAEMRQELLVNQVAGHQRVASQSAQSVKSTTT
jgi:hypothetical protein